MAESYYELWDLASANLVAHSDMGDDLPALVRELIELGWDVEELSLGRSSGKDHYPASFWEGDGLKAWAADQTAAPTRKIGEDG